ncbi:putative nuclease HARBI1 [Diadema setosum]|uniref:putative nuclease HARBI1 n=1 Tax=Diadema setosum TaxID=31175 RepID=UPI003B3BA50E
MPNTLGCIDCTHIPLRAPSENEHTFVNRKGRHTMNIQAIVDSKMRFLNVVAKWPGSTHDAFIWESCNVLEDFRMGRMPAGWLLGDSGYPLQPWLLTPVANPNTQSERRFNSSLSRTRVCVEQAFGLLKSRFRCLDLSGGSLCYDPLRVCKITISCCVLHNICIARNIQPPDNIVNMVLDQDDAPFPDFGDNRHAERGQQIRRHLIDTWFT